VVKKGGERVEEFVYTDDAGGDTDLDIEKGDHPPVEK